MQHRHPVAKTHKLFIDGKFPRSESGRTIALTDVGQTPTPHVARGSRKDVRDAVTAARKAHDAWRDATPYHRGQVLYRVAEMLETRRSEAEQAVAAAGASVNPRREIDACIDRLVVLAGWADKFLHVLGAQNPVAGPFYTMTAPEPIGVVAVLAPDAPPMLGLVALTAPVICSGNTAVVLAGGSSAARLAAVMLAEAVTTSDVPAGVINILTGDRAELAPIVASHRDVDGVHAASSTAEIDATLRGGSAENLKRVAIRANVDWFDHDACAPPDWIADMLDAKTIWHPVGA